MRSRSFPSWRWSLIGKLNSRGLPTYKESNNFYLERPFITIQQNGIVNASGFGKYLLSNFRWILSSNRYIRVSHIWYRLSYMLKLISKLHEVFFQSHKTFLKIFTWIQKALLSLIKNTDWQTKNGFLVLPSSTSLSRSDGSSFPFIFFATLFLSSRSPSTSCYLQSLISWTERRKQTIEFNLSKSSLATRQ